MKTSNRHNEAPSKSVEIMIFCRITNARFFPLSQNSFHLIQENTWNDFMQFFKSIKCSFHCLYTLCCFRGPLQLIQLIINNVREKQRIDQSYFKSTYLWIWHFKIAVNTLFFFLIKSTQKCVLINWLLLIWFLHFINEIEGCNGSQRKCSFHFLIYWLVIPFNVNVNYFSGRLISTKKKKMEKRVSNIFIYQATL